VRQAMAFCELGLAGLATSEKAALGQKVGSGGAMDCAVHASSTEQGTVGRVDDRIHSQRGDVGLENCDSVAHLFLCVCPRESAWAEVPSFTQETSAANY